MILDPLLLSRLQFAWVVAFHILLPAFTIGLASYIALLEALNFATGRDVYFRLSTFWTRIFAISFGMGVVSGIVMPFQFGTNWSRFSDATSNVLSPLLAYEGLTAFFLEAAFLGSGKDPAGNTRAGFHAATTINRKDFGLNWNKALEAGGFLVGDEVKIAIDAEGVAAD